MNEPILTIRVKIRNVIRLQARILKTASIIPLRKNGEVIQGVWIYKTHEGLTHIFLSHIWSHAYLEVEGYLKGIEETLKRIGLEKEERFVMSAGTLPKEEYSDKYTVC